MGSMSLAGRAICAVLAAALCVGAASSASGGSRSQRVDVVAVPFPAEGFVVAVLPLENLGEISTPVESIQAALLEKLASRDVPLLDGDVLADFMRRNRMRYTGGLPRGLGRAFRDETGAGGVLITSVDLYDDAGFPRFAMTARLVSADDEPRILWMETASGAGDEAPGFLGLGRIFEPSVMVDILVDRIAAALASFLAPAGTRATRGGSDPHVFHPVTFSRSVEASRSQRPVPRIAVLPLANSSATRHAGDVVALQLVKWLVDSRSFDVVEPGVVRRAMLQSRLIQEGGPSVPQSDLLRLLLGVDIVLSGEVFGFSEAGPAIGYPVVEFSIRAMDTGKRQVIWSSLSHARGNKGVFFFELGKVQTAQDLASGMARGLVEAVVASREGSS